MQCNNTGYKGEQAFSEMAIDEAIQEMIVNQRSSPKSPAQRLLPAKLKTLQKDAAEQSD